MVIAPADDGVQAKDVAKQEREDRLSFNIERVGKVPGMRVQPPAGGEAANGDGGASLRFPLMLSCDMMNFLNTVGAVADADCRVSLTLPEARLAALQACLGQMAPLVRVRVPGQKPRSAGSATPPPTERDGLHHPLHHRRRARA